MFVTLRVIDGITSIPIFQSHGNVWDIEQLFPVYTHLENVKRSVLVDNSRNLLWRERNINILMCFRSGKNVGACYICYIYQMLFNIRKLDWPSTNSSSNFPRDILAPIRALGDRDGCHVSKLVWLQELVKASTGR